MTQTEQSSREIIFSKDAIDEQIQRIFTHPVFATSDVLKRFLFFVVEETLSGRSNQLKEYTVGVKVLHKPVNFKPQQDAIVRIHAGRLRRALNYYYKDAGTTDTIYVTIPKGSYVPVISKALSGPQKNNAEGVNEAFINSMTVGVMPFSYAEKNKFRIAFADGLGIQLSTELARIKNLSVIAYYTMRRLAEKIFDIREIAPAVGAQYIFSGDIQCLKNRFRINVQMINTHSGEQVWGNMYEHQVTEINVFRIQDDIVSCIITMMEKMCAPVTAKVGKVSLMAVA